MHSVPSDFETADDAPAPVQRPQPYAVIPGEELDFADASGPQGTVTICTIRNAVFQCSIALTDEGLGEIIDRLQQLRDAHIGIVVPAKPGLIVPGRG